MRSHIIRNCAAVHQHLSATPPIGNSPHMSNTLFVCLSTDGSVTIRTCCCFVRDDGGTRSESTVGCTSEGRTAYPCYTNSDVYV